mgnify:CR=1 FL=1
MNDYHYIVGYFGLQRNKHVSSGWLAFLYTCAIKQDEVFMFARGITRVLYLYVNYKEQPE